MAPVERCEVHPVGQPGQEQAGREGADWRLHQFWRKRCRRGCVIQGAGGVGAVTGKINLHRDNFGEHCVKEFCG